MTKRARIIFGGRDYDVTPYELDGVIQNLVKVSGAGGSSQISFGEPDDRVTLFWTPGAPIAFEVWDDGER